MGVLAGFRERNKTSSAAVAVSVKQTGSLCECIMERPVAASVRRSPSLPDYNTSTSTLAFDQHFTTTLKGILLQAEIVSVTFEFMILADCTIISSAKIKLMTRSKWLFIQESLSGRAVIWMLTIDINRNIKQLTVMVKVYINSTGSLRL